MTEELRVLALCEMDLGVRVLSFRDGRFGAVYCWGCLYILQEILDSEKHFTGYPTAREFFSTLQIKPRPGQ